MSRSFSFKQSIWQVNPGSQTACRKEASGNTLHHHTALQVHRMHKFVMRSYISMLLTLHVQLVQGSDLILDQLGTPPSNFPWQIETKLAIKSSVWGCRLPVVWSWIGFKVRPPALNGILTSILASFFFACYTVGFGSVNHMNIALPSTTVPPNPYSLFVEGQRSVNFVDLRNGQYRVFKMKCPIIPQKFRTDEEIFHPTMFLDDWYGVGECFLCKCLIV